MAIILTDEEIGNLLIEVKPLPDDWKKKLGLQAKQDAAFRHRGLTVDGVSGKHFRIIIRQAVNNPEDFSIILMFMASDGTEYRLSRFNGRHPSEHTNRIEKLGGQPNASFRNVFHIHRATERYQLAGRSIDSYAEPTTAYNSIDSALAHFLDLYRFTHQAEFLPLFHPPGGSQP